MGENTDKKMAVELHKACTLWEKGLYSRKKDISFDADLLRHWRTESQGSIWNFQEEKEIRQGGRQYVEITGHPGTGTGTCDIGEQFAKGLDGLWIPEPDYTGILLQTSY